MEKIILYAGPSLCGGNIDKWSKSVVKILPPVKRGDIYETLTKYPPSTMVIADGVFHSVLSVGHAEIRQAIELGWEVWGVSSMGAIRAAEMTSMGMNGFGEVYERFRVDDDFSDDEVALLHAPMEPYFSISEPLIHIRHFVSYLIEQDKISEKTGDLIIKLLKNRWFGERTLELTKTLLDKYGQMAGSEAEELLKGIEKHRIKKKDLLNLMQLLMAKISSDVEYECCRLG